MVALRWILLGIGLLFLAALAAWELRRPRQAAERGEPPLGSAGETGAVPEQTPSAASGTRQRASAPPRVDLPPLEPEIPFEPEGYTDPGAQPPVAAVLPPEQPVRVQWPPDAERRVLALRIVPAGEEPLSGRSVRQALGACGFAHGALQIYHQPAEDGRALLSAASLRNPGTLDPATMDFQRFAGLSLFAVLPGPLAAGAALDHLLHTARDLAQRLNARLQDEHGAALDATRIESMRRTAHGMSGPPEHGEPAG